MKINWTKLSSRERDAVVAEKVMGLERLSCHAGNCFYRIEIVNGKEKDFEGLAPNYTTCIKDAWMVVEKLDTTPFILERLTTYYGLKKPWNVMFVYKNKPKSGYAQTLPEAIAIASLRALGCEVLV